MDFKLTPLNVKDAFHKHASEHARSSIAPDVINSNCEQAATVLCGGKKKVMER